MDNIHSLATALPTGHIVHVEVCLKPSSTSDKHLLEPHLKFILNSLNLNKDGITITDFSENDYLQKHVECVTIYVGKEYFSKNGNKGGHCEVQYHIYHSLSCGPALEELDDEDLSAASHWLLPSTDFHGLWESLVYDSNVKQELLDYARTTLLFADRKVDSTLVSWNRVILLHGPPGTGKTSLCRALAQKLSILLCDKYSCGQLIEVNSHSLFSKWFSESGKLVLKMFQKIQEIVNESESLVFILIDEVESLAAARKLSMSGTEPSDAIRVVNALLTQLDQLKKYPNVIILTTSNITGAIDLAFVDRADIKQYLGPPSPRAIYQIFYTAINELIRTGIVDSSSGLMDVHAVETLPAVPVEMIKLMDIAKRCQGLSGRTLRKLPFLAHSWFIQSMSAVDLSAYLEALSCAVDREILEQKLIDKN